MPNLQTPFRKFHKNIALDYTNNSELRIKRSILVRELKLGLRRIFENRPPVFKDFNQGSYDLQTGVKPLEGDDYDIDVGIIFNISKNDYFPLEVKQWVHEALDTGVRTVQVRRSCVRVQYHQNSERLYHVDLAVYSNPDFENIFERKHHIAKGYIGSKDEYKIWEVSNPFELRNILKTKFGNTDDSAQFRRVITYLKRWKDYNFYSDSSEKPTGIALTACAFSFFQPSKEFVFNPILGSTFKYDDLRATTKLVLGIINHFDSFDQIKINLPVEPYNNLFEKMTIIQMNNFKTQLFKLKDALFSALLDSNSKDSCVYLQKVFGEDFPTYGK